MSPWLEICSLWQGSPSKCGPEIHYFCAENAFRKQQKKVHTTKKEICPNCRIYSSPKQPKRLKSLFGLPKKDAGRQIAGYKNCRIYPTIMDNYISDNAFRKVHSVSSNPVPLALPIAHVVATAASSLSTTHPFDLLKFADTPLQQLLVSDLDRWRARARSSAAANHFPKSAKCGRYRLMRPRLAP